MNQIRQNKDTSHAKGSVEKKNKKLNGYLALYRRVLLLLREKKLKNLTELGAYVAFLLTADWEEEHEAFGCIPPNTKLQQLAGMNHSRWSHYRGEFLKRGLLQKRRDGLTEIPYFWKYHPRVAQKLSKMSFADTQEEVAFLQSRGAITQKTDAKAQIARRSADNGTPKDIGYLIRKTDKYFAFPQTSSRPKETQRNYKENLKQDSAKHAPKDIQYQCEKCGEGVTAFLAQIVLKQTARRLCMPCYMRGRAATKNGAATDTKPPLS